MANKVLIISPSYPPSSSGAAIYYASLITSHKYSDSIVVLTTKQQNKSEQDDRVYRSIPNLVERNIFTRLFVLPWVTLAMITRLKSKYGITHLQAHSSTAITLGAALASRLFRLPISYDVQDNMAIVKVMKIGYQPNYICIGRSVAERLIKQGVDKDKIIVVPTLPPEDLPARPLDLQQSIFVFVGQLNFKGKGIDILLKGFGLLLRDQPQAKLWLIGQGRHKKKILQAIRSAGIGPSVEVYGRISWPETLIKISQASALVLPSRSEAQPRVIVEAMAMKTPVIATKVGGVPELLGESQRGLLIEQDDIYGLHKAMLRISQNAEDINSVVEAGTKYINELPSWSELQAKIWNFVIREHK